MQGTGNGHITRARALAPALKKAGVDVDYVFSGRDPGGYFDMQEFGDYRVFTGLTLKMKAGRVDYPSTLFGNRPLRFLRNVVDLDTRGYDLVLTDFEPVTAWAGRRCGSRVIGMGHQYAFRYPVPLAGATLVGRAVFNYFAPAGESVGLHWHHFDQPILPPMIQQVALSDESDPGLIVVYLPSAKLEPLLATFNLFSDHRFHVYTSVDQEQQHGHVCLKPFSRDGFQHDLASCGAVICNAGFALVSEILMLGKKALVIPLLGHMEQLSNAAALDELNYLVTTRKLTAKELGRMLNAPPGLQHRYPDTASLLVERLLSGHSLTDSAWVGSVWDRVETE